VQESRQSFGSDMLKKIIGKTVLGPVQETTLPEDSLLNFRIKENMKVLETLALDLDSQLSSADEKSSTGQIRRLINQGQMQA